MPLSLSDSEGFFFRGQEIGRVASDWGSTVSVSQWKLVPAQGGFKSGVLNCTVLWWKKTEPGFRLSGLIIIIFFLYSHQFLVVQEAQEVPGEKGRTWQRERGLSDSSREEVISFKKTYWPQWVHLQQVQDDTAGTGRLFVFYELRKWWFFGKFTSLNANQNGSVTEPTSTPTAISPQQHVNLPKVDCHSILLFFFLFVLCCRKKTNICFVLTDLKISLRAFFSATKAPVWLARVQRRKKHKHRKEGGER